MIDFARPYPSSWGAQIQEPHDDPRGAFFELLGRKAIGLPGRSSAARRQFNRLVRNGLFRRDGYYCQYCGVDMLASVNSLMTITKDHVVPRSRGGKNSQANLVCCCQACNCLKADTRCGTLEEAQHLVTQLRQERAHMLLKLRETYR